MTLHEKLQEFGLKAEYFIYKTAWLWLLLFMLTVFAFGIYITMNVWYECRTEHSFFYCLSLISS